jgi:hypothetical protein
MAKIAQVMKNALAYLRNDPRPKKYHWYSVRYYYRVKDDLKFDWTTQVGMTKQSDILVFRDVRKLVTPMHLDPVFRKSNLRNGRLTLTIECYIGHFEKPVIKS